MTRIVPIRVLVVDDSAFVRKLLHDGLSSDPQLLVVGAARDPYEARDLLVRERPDVVTLDLELPRMDGVSFMRRFMAVLPTPTIVLSSLSRDAQRARAAFDAGAWAVLQKASGPQGIAAMLDELIRTIKLAAQVRREPTGAGFRLPTAEHALPPAAAPAVIGMAASTGGVSALGRILPSLPANTPGIVIVQHMPAGFTADFARRLDGQCAMRVSEARDGERLFAGRVLVAPGGDRHLEIRRRGSDYLVQLVQGAPVSGHVPSVDVFFMSLARAAGANAAACILTGMGVDGARGMLALRRQGAYTLAQDRATSAVWGMPGAAIEAGAVMHEFALAELPSLLSDWADRRAAHAG